MTDQTSTPDRKTPDRNTQDTVAVARNDEAGRFEVTVNGEVAGFTVFKDREDQRIFPHTEVDEKFSGRGLATKLIGDALEATRRDGLRVVAVCPAVARYVAKHPEVGDNVDPVTPAILQSLG